MPGTPLGKVLPEPQQDVVVAGLLRRLWAQPHDADAFRPLAQMCAAWAEEFEAAYAAAPAADRPDRGLARAGISLFRELPGTAASRVLLCTDLHADNILSARPGPRPGAAVAVRPHRAGVSRIAAHAAGRRAARTPITRSQGRVPLPFRAEGDSAGQWSRPSGTGRSLGAAGVVAGRDRSVADGADGAGGG